MFKLVMLFYFVVLILSSENNFIVVNLNKDLW